MEIFIATISILVITGVGQLFNRILPFRVCLICAGVSGTWLWIITGINSGWLEADGWLLIAAIAMGGSVVGVAYQFEKRLHPHRSTLLWKMIFIPAGFAAAYSILAQWWIVFLVMAIFLVILVLRFAPLENASRTGFAETPWSEVHNKKIAAESELRRIGREELAKKMKDCC
ncbi:MAG TPA: hypothetical protein VJC20_00985 [Candidatus Paceibacterota bacterium]